MNLKTMSSLSLVAAIALSCQSRKYNSDNLSGGTAPSVPDSFSYPGFTGEAAWRSNIKDENPVTTTPSRNYVQDLKTTDGYTDHYKKIADRADNPPMKFAAKTVLEAMRRIRYLTFTKSIYDNSMRGKEFNVSSFVGSSNPDLASILGFGTGTDCPKGINPGAEQCQDSWVRSFGDQDNDTLVGEEASHWSDLQMHFYATTAHGRHGCYTSVFRAAKDDLLTTGKYDMFDGDDFDGSVETTPATLRRAAIDVCGWGREIKADAKAKLGYNLPYIEKLAPQFSHLYHSLWVDKLGTFQKFEDKPASRSDATTKELVNMFEYVMLAQTFAFDDEQQQQVVNAFYGDHKLASENKDIEVDNEVDCNYFRPIRSGSYFEKVGSGTRCKTDKRDTVLTAKGY